jgi:protein O-GlcNAc transferase
MRLSRHDEAVQAFRQCLQLRPNDPDALQHLGIAYASMGLQQDAVDALEKAIRVKPDHPEAYSRLGLAYQKMNRLDDAVRSFQQGVRVRPNDGVLHAALGSVFIAQERWQDAADAYEQAVWLRPDDMDGQRNLGIALDKLGRHERGAGQLLRRAIEQRPDRRRGALSLRRRPGAGGRERRGRAVRFATP